MSAFGVDHSIEVSKIAPRMVYHGTNMATARKIMRVGFRNAKKGESRKWNQHEQAPREGGVFVAPERKVAEVYADRQLSATFAAQPASRRHKNHGGHEELMYDASQLIPTKRGLSRSENAGYMRVGRRIQFQETGGVGFEGRKKPGEGKLISGAEYHGGKAPKKWRKKWSRIGTPKERPGDAERAPL